MDPQYIKELRQRFGWSQEGLARELGMCFGTVNRWENGKATPSPMALRGLRMIDAKSTGKESRKRVAFRLQTNFPIEVWFSGYETMGDVDVNMPFISTITENLSSIGLMFKTQTYLKEGKILRISWNFGRKKHYEVISRVIWTSREEHEHSVGVSFDHPMPDVIGNVLDTLI